jgi:hypothetical protein
MRTASTTCSTATYVAPTSNTALRTIRLRCASDPVGGSRIGPTNYATTLVAPPAATRARQSSILGGPVSTLGSGRSRLTVCDAAAPVEPLPRDHPGTPVSLKRFQDDGLNPPMPPRWLQQCSTGKPWSFSSAGFGRTEQAWIDLSFQAFREFLRKFQNDLKRPVVQADALN